MLQKILRCFALVSIITQIVLSHWIIDLSIYRTCVFGVRYATENVTMVGMVEG